MALIKKYKIIILIIIFLNLLVISKTTLATTPDEITRKMTVGGSEIHQFEGAGNIILGALKVVGTICSVGMLMVIGIKYMMGSIEEKAEYKKTIWIYILGAVLVFGISTLGQKLYEFTTSMF